MDNTMRKQLLMRHRQSGFPGSIIDVFAAAEQGIDLIGQFEQQQNMQVAQTPEQQQQGLRPAHQAGNVTQSMAFPNVPPNTPFNTVGMKAPINIQKFDEQGHLVKSYENVPPGVRNLPTGPQRGTVIETPANMQSGGRRLKKDALEMFPALKALGNVKVKADTEFTKEKTGIGDIEYFAPGQEVITYPTGERVEHPGSDRRHTVLVNPDTNDAQNVALDMLHGLPAEDPKYGMLIEEFGEALGDDETKYFYELDREKGLAEDGYDQYRQNYIDGKLRNLLFQGTEEDFKNSRYNPEERAQIQQYNPIAYDKFLEIESYLRSPRKKMQAGGVQEGGRLEEAMRLIKEHNMKDDSTFENIVEMFDPTGISAWDDAYRAYNSMKERGSSTPNFDEALDMLGAIPVMGKTKAAVNLYKKSHKPIRYGLTQAYNKIFRHTGRAASIADGIEDETGFLDSKEQSKPVQRQAGGPKKYQGAGALEFGQTGPDFETYGPGLRVDGETYQASRETGATRVPLFGDGTQRPILLGAAEVYDEPLSGVPQDYTPETKALADEGAAGVAERRNQAAGIGLAAVGDYFSAAQRYGVSAPLSLAMGKTPNLSATPLMDRALGAESPNAFPSEVLGVQNPYGAAAIDMVTDPGTALGLGLLGKSAVQQGSRAASRLSAGNRFRTGLTNPATRKTYSGSDIAKGLEANAKRYGINIDAQDIARRTTRTRPGTAAFDKPTASQAFGDALIEYPRVMREADVTLREQYLQGAPGRDRIMGNFDELYGSAAPNQEIDDAFRQFFISKKEDHVYGPTLRTPGSAAQRQFLRDRYAQHFDTNVVKSIPELNVHYKIRGAKGYYDPRSHSIHNSTQAMGFGMHDRGRGLKHATRSLDSARSLQTHEGTHALFPYRDSPAMERKVGDQLRGGLPKAEYTTPSRLEPGSYNRYLRSPTEVDARVAEMRLKMSQGANRSGNFNLQDRGEIDNLLSRVESDKRFAKKFAKDAGVRIDNSRNHLRDVTKSQGPLVDIGIGRLYNSKFTPRVRGFGRNVMGLMGFGPTGYQRQATEYLNLAKYARKRGGPRKFQSGGFADRNYLPPIAQEIERAGGFDEYQAQQEQASNLKNINNRPTISQGNFDVDEEGNIIKERASTLDMLANPMATLRTALDPSVEGLPSAGELNSAKSKGNVAGQIANDMVNPAAWVNYGKNAVRDLSQGNFTSAGLNALGAIPGIPSAAGLGKTAMKYGRSPYLLNTNRANKYDFRNIGDKPHLWRGYENTSIDPTRLDPNSNFRGYFDDLYTTESVAKKPIWDEFKSQPTNYSRTSPEAHQAAHKKFRRMDDAATEARTAFNAKHAPFLGDEVGRGSYGRVYQFKNNPDYVFKIGKSEGSNANPAFQRALEQFGNRSNIATPLQKSNFTITEPHFGNSAGAGEALVMRNLNSPTFGTQQFAGLNARQARALQIKTARQLRDAGIGLDFAADARNLASSNVSPNLTNFFDLHYRPGLQHNSRYLANQFLRK